MANVIPIHKKSDKNDVGNYRPISVTLVLCKLMESILKDDLSQYLESTSLLTKVQHGFSRGRSCLTNLLESFEEWTAALGQ